MRNVELNNEPGDAYNVIPYESSVGLKGVLLECWDFEGSRTLIDLTPVDTEGLIALLQTSLRELGVEA